MARMAIGAYVIWLRDLKRFWRDRMRRIGAFVQPLIYLFLLGTGLEAAFGVFGTGDINYVAFMYPGIVGMTILFTAVFSGISIIWDREFGFLKEMMVAPIPRTSVALGKVTGGGTTAFLQGIILLLFMPLVSIPYSVEKIVLMLLFMLALAMSLSSMGVLIAARMRSFEGFPIVINFILLPMFFLSGAMFPLQNLPGWMEFLTKINPLTYAVDALRGICLKGVEITSGASLPMMPRLEIQVYPLWLDFLVIFGFGLFLLIVTVWRFNRQE
jgi:ABC-2 type transport system permease protein